MFAFHYRQTQTQVSWFAFSGDRWAREGVCAFSMCIDTRVTDIDEGYLTAYESVLAFGATVAWVLDVWCNARHEHTHSKPRGG